MQISIYTPLYRQVNCKVYFDNRDLICAYSIGVEYHDLCYKVRFWSAGFRVPRCPGESSRFKCVSRSKEIRGHCSPDVACIRYTRLHPRIKSRTSSIYGHAIFSDCLERDPIVSNKRNAYSSRKNLRWRWLLPNVPYLSEVLPSLHSVPRFQGCHINVLDRLGQS